jgi:predicted ATPase
MMIEGCLFALTGRPRDAIPLITAGMTSARSTGANLRLPWYFSCLTRAHAALGQCDEARRCLDEAMAVMKTTGETWQAADLHRMAGELALMAPDRDAAKAEAHFVEALTVARAQQAKAWELRAATNLARLWRDQDKRAAAVDLLAPIHGWFTEGFETLDLQEAAGVLAGLKS